jgi:hypothetical protein
MKALSLFLLLLLAGFITQAQPTITLLTFESYTFQDQFDTEYGTGKVEDGFQWGGGLEFELKENVAVELIYQNMKTNAYYYGFDNGVEQRFEGTLGVNYILVGATRYTPVNEKISGFGTFDMGVGIFNPSSKLASDDVVKFTLGGRLGVRIKASEKVSLRIHGQLLSPVQWAGAGFYFGSGGSGTGVSTGSTIWQWNLGGSLNFRLK